jgi:hypothetical protein
MLNQPLEKASIKIVYMALGFAIMGCFASFLRLIVKDKSAR